MPKRFQPIAVSLVCFFVLLLAANDDSEGKDEIKTSKLDPDVTAKDCVVHSGAGAQHARLVYQMHLVHFVATTGLMTTTCTTSCRNFLLQRHVTTVA